MQKLRIALLVMIVFVAVASYVKERGRSVAESPFPAPSPVDGSRRAATPTPTPSATPSVSRVLSPANVEVVRACLTKDPALPRVHVDEATTLGDVLRDLSPTTSSARLNVHVRRPDGREERLIVQPPEGARESFKLGAQELRVFDVDREGLPIVRAFPRELKRDSLTHAVNAFIGDDEVIFRERRAQYEFSGGVASSVETDGAMNELQLQFGRTTLGCAWQSGAMDCACL